MITLLKSVRTAGAVASHFPVMSLTVNTGRLLLVSLVVIWCAFLSPVSSSYAQEEKDHTENTPDTALRSYARVDPSTLGMTLQIPLGSYPGRAGHNMPIFLSYSSKVWGVNYADTEYNEVTGARLYDVLDSAFGQHSVVGWVSSFSIPRIKWPQNEKFSSAGIPGKCGPGTPSPACYYISRFHVYLPDGSSHELRKDDLARTSFDKTGVFYAVDDSRLKFDTATNILWLPDGSRYVFNPISFNEQTATQYIDRDGNTININPVTRQWTDTLGRVLSDPLPVAPAPGGQWDSGYDPNRPPVGDNIYTLPGVGASTKTFTLRWRRLADVLTPDPGTGQVPPLRYRGDFKDTMGNPMMPAPHLFTSNSNMRIAVEQALFNPSVLHEIVLPNGSIYRFTYNEYGEINKIVYPTGGYERFLYGQIPHLSTVKFGPYQQPNRGVLNRWLSPSGLSIDEQPWQYSAVKTSSYYLVTVTAPDNTRTERYMHRSPNTNYLYFGFEDVRAGRSYEERAYSASSVLLRRSLTQWTISGPTPGGHSSATRDPRATKAVNIVLDTGASPALAATVINRFEQASQPLNLTSVTEYGYESVDQTTAQTAGIESFNPVDSLAIRTTETAYLDNADYNARNLVSLPVSVTIRTGMPITGQVKARSEMLYDEPLFAPLPCGATVGWTDPGPTVKRGNVTSIKTWLDTLGPFTSAGAYLARHTQYDQCGSVRKTWDPRDTALSNPTQIDYSHQFSYPTLNTSPDPDGGGPLLSLTTSTEYDVSTGLVTATIDVNGQRTTFGYNDPLNRLKQVVRAADDPVAKNQSTYSYDDSAQTITVTSDLNTYGDNLLKTVTVYDGIGRKTESRIFEGGTDYIATQQQYDNLGRVFKASNPFRPWQGQTPVWTTTTYDALGRTLTVTTPDNSVVTTSYSGNTVTVTDQVGKARKSVTDALGRLKEIYEDPNGLNYLTSYGYDVLDDLTTVTQGAQTRSFVYDSLKRLTSATNPESGTVSYQYDNNGNLTQKTDARSVVTIYAYDSLNRNTTVDYSDTAGINPDITRVYDTATNGKGRLRESYAGGTETAGTNVEHTKIVSYDAMGRPLDQRQRFKTNSVWSAEFRVQRGYNLAGAVTSQIYPSNRTVNYSYDPAGRLNSFTGYLGDGLNRNYSTEVLYSPFGGMSKEKFGTDTPLYNKSFYNSRGQLSEIRVGLSPTGGNWQRGAIINHYSSQCWGACNGTDNNGNVKSQDHWIPNDSGGVQAIFTQSFTYDNLNRLLRANEGSNWQQESVYDRWGNRTIHQTNTWGTGINKKDFTVNTANNRLGVPGGQSGVMTYDNAGNLTNDTYTGAGSRVYDAENRMTKAWGGNNQWQEYSYNADGQRTRRKIDGVETWQSYGMDGELLAEYAANAAVTTPKKEYGYRNGQLLVTATVPLTSGIGLQGQYFDNMNFTDLKVTRTDATVNFDWGGGTPDPVIGVDTFTTRWQGRVEPQYSQTYTFYTLTDDGVRLWVNGQLIIDKWIDQGPTEWSGQIALTAGQRYDIVMEFYENGGGATAKLSWSSASQPKQIIPQSRLYPPGSSSQVSFEWLVADQLGTPRIILDKTGSLATTKRHDYLPFGEELFAGMGGRTTALGYTADTIRQKFTSSERDNETGLDYFKARYYSAIQGRFTSVDPSRVSIDLESPQSWNRYSYTYNRPLALVDENGKWPTEIHNLIIDRALPRLSNAQRQEIKNGSWSVDDPTKGGQNTSRSNEHGMTIPGQSQEDAAANADTFINTNVDNAKWNYAHHGLTASLYDFGRAFHTVSDMTSPAHEGYQVWHASDTLSHRQRESSINNFRMGLAVGATLALYKYTYGQAELNRATRYIPGSENDPSIRAIRAEHSLPGSSAFAEAEALHDYRRGLHEGLNFDWGRQRGRRGER